MPLLDLHEAESECGEGAASLVRRALAGLGAGDQLVVITDVAEHVLGVRTLAGRARRRVLLETTRERERRLLIG